MTPSSLTTARPRIAPIVPVTRRQPFNDRNWLFEFKYDGFWGVLYLTRQGARSIQSAAGKYRKTASDCL
jgi:ATP-dependent DNA ligase